MINCKFIYYDKLIYFSSYILRHINTKYLDANDFLRRDFSS